MKALYKSQLISAIEINFKENEIIFENDWKLKEMWNQLGHDWFISDGQWQETKWNDTWSNEVDDE